jgi:hypothetical protein
MKIAISSSLLVLFLGIIAVAEAFAPHHNRHMHKLQNPISSASHKGFSAVYKPTGEINPFFAEEAGSPVMTATRERAGEMIKFDEAQLNAVIANQNKLIAMKKANSQNSPGSSQGGYNPQDQIENYSMNKNYQIAPGPMPMGGMGYGAMNVGGWGYPTVNGFDWFGNYEMVNMKYMHSTPYSSYYPYGSSYYNWCKFYFE